MRSLSWMLVLALAYLAAPAGAQTRKPGLWEVNIKMVGSVGVDTAIAQARQQMANMSPEQRKAMEDMMAQRGMKMGAAGGADTGGMTVQTCVTPEMAARNEMPMQQRGNCTSTTSERSPSGMKIAFTCTDPASSGEGQINFSGPGAYILKMNINTTVAGKSEAMAVESSGKWLSTECGAVKPLAPPQK